LNNQSDTINRFTTGLNHLRTAGDRRCDVPFYRLSYKSFVIPTIGEEQSTPKKLFHPRSRFESGNRSPLQGEVLIQFFHPTPFSSVRNPGSFFAFMQTN
jgi:hypothetical protein